MLSASLLFKFTKSLFVGGSFILGAQLFAIAQPSPPASEISSPRVSLVSPATQIDYSTLQKDLAEGDFQEANETTRRLLYEAAGRSRQGWLTTDSIAKLACADLTIMDDLWRQYSNNRFGFSPQYNIFTETGNRPGRLMSPDAYDKFGDAVGWRKNGEWIIFKQNLDYSPDALPGHLPNPREEYRINGGRLEYTMLMGRFQACQGGESTPFIPFTLPKTSSPPVPKGM